MVMIVHDDFGAVPNLRLNGSAGIGGDVLRLTPALGTQAGSAFLEEVLSIAPDTSFTTQFSFEIGGGDGTDLGGDGLAFVLQGDPAGVNALGGLGWKLGLGGGPAERIDNSLAITFDTFRNPFDVSVNQVALILDGRVQFSGAPRLDLPLATLDLNGGQIGYAWIDYDGDTERLEVFVSGSSTKPGTPVLVAENLELDAIVGSEAYAGFTAATGNTNNYHDVRSWVFTTDEAAPPPPSGDGFIFAGFADNVGVLARNGAAIVAGNGHLRLTTTTSDTSGSAFYTTPLAVDDETSFSTRFSFEIGDGGPGGDGFAFILQNDPDGSAALGWSNWALGLGGRNAAERITNSLAITFDTVRNPFDMSDNQIALILDGRVPFADAPRVNLPTSVFDLDNGDRGHAWVDYDGTRDRLQVFVSADPNDRGSAVLVVEDVQLDAIVGEQAYVGFTASNGSDRQDIVNWAFATDATIAPPPSAEPAFLTYADFDGSTTLEVNGSAALIDAALQLTPTEAGRAGSAFHVDPLAIDGETSFSTDFTFQLDGGTAGGEGFAFVLHNDDRGLDALGQSDRWLGLGGADGAGKIFASLAVTFDTVNDGFDVSANQIGLILDGRMSQPDQVRVPLPTSVFDLNGGTRGHAWIDYDGAVDRLEVYVGSSPTKPGAPVLVAENVALDDIVGDQAYAGFTGSTSADGGSNNAHRILDWRLEQAAGDATSPPPPPPTTPGAIDPVARINFQPSTSPIPADYAADSGRGFTADRGYGWVTAASAGTADPVSAGLPSADLVDRNAGVGTPRIDARLASFAQFDGATRAWEHALADGWYVVTIAFGDVAGPLDPAYALEIEGAPFGGFAPSDEFLSSLVTQTVEVTDGRLTIGGAGGAFDKLQYVEIAAIGDRTPDDDRPATADYPRFVQGLASVAGEPAVAIEQARNIDPTAAFALEVSLIAGDGGVDPASFSERTVRLYDTLSGVDVPIGVNTTGGFDALIVQPSRQLQPDTSYTLRIDGVTDLAGVEFVPYGTTFATGEFLPSDPLAVAFTTTDVASGAPFTSLVVSPDGSSLYATSLTGTIHRWIIDPATGDLLAPETFDLPGLAGRPMIGMVFDPTDTGRLWVTSHDPANLLGPGPAPDFSSKITHVDIGTANPATWTVTDYVVGLPRSSRDHLTNSLVFRENPSDPGDFLLYTLQGSNSAMGAPDAAWAFRPERLLSAAVLEIDPDRDVSAGPIDVRTEPDSNAYDPSLQGALAGFYDPFAADAPVQIYASGLRNAYDLVWHSNGFLYVPTNGSAAGGSIPDDPSTPANEGFENIEQTQNDFLYRVEADGYYGHPNPRRGEFVMNGGNPTDLFDPAQVDAYPIGTLPDPNWRGIAYDFGSNRSANGIIEYTSGVVGGALQGRLLVVEYSGGDDIVALELDPATGEVIDMDLLRDPTGEVLRFRDPLDLVEDPASGRIYVANLRNGSITMLDPVPSELVDTNTTDLLLV